MGARFSCSLLSCAKNLFEQANLGPWCWRRFRVVPVQHLHQSAQAWKILLRPRSAHSIQMRDQMQGSAFVVRSETAEAVRANKRITLMRYSHV